MLLKREVLERISTGEIDLVFRRWKRPTIRSGGSLRTSMGVLSIGRVGRIRPDEIDASDARRAGFADAASLLDRLSRRTDGDLYRIEVEGFVPDPRVALRGTTGLSQEALAQIESRLEAMDSRSQGKPWTRPYLDAIADNPNVLAQDLADGLGVDKSTFKGRVRRLKELGLTVSRSPGYELSARGREVYEYLTR